MGAGEASAGPDVFTSGGPYGGAIMALVKVTGISPPSDDIVFAGTAQSGVFKSTDGATTWTAANTGLFIPQVRALVIADPTPPITIYAGTAGGVFKSTNGGANWAAVNTGLTNLNVNALAAAPTDPNTLYAGTLGGVFVTVNGGATWSPGTIATSDVRALVVCPCFPDVAYAGTNGGGVYKTIDNGSTWSPMNTGIPAGPAMSITALTIGDATNPDVLYAGTDGAGVYVSTDGALSWAPDNFGLGTPFIEALKLEPPGSVPRVLIAGTGGGGVWRGDDVSGTGMSWASINGTPPIDLTNHTVRAIAFNPIIYAGTVGQGVFLTVDGGANWAEMNAGLAATDPVAIAIDPTTPTTVYAADGLFGGVYKSTTGGASWSRVSDASLLAQVLTTLAIDPAGTTLYAGNSFSGIWKSTNSGVTWAPINTGSLGLLSNPWVTALVMDPTDPLTLYLATEVFGVVDHIHKTTNGGGTWTDMGPLLAPLPNPFVRTLVVDPTNPSIVYAGSSSGVFKSTTGGTAGSWVQMNTGLTTVSVEALVMQPGASNTLLVSTAGGGIFRTTNGAATWSPSNTGNPSLGTASLAFDPGNPNVVFAGTASSSVQGSVDGGLTWTFFNPGLLFSGAVKTLAVDPIVHAGIQGQRSGVFDNSYTLQPLTVVPAGGGTGTVTALPGPINCGPTCSAQQLTTTKVKLTATAAAGSVFAGWSGGGCSGTGTCTVTMTAATTVTATFVPIGAGPFILTVNKTGSATGTVTVTPPGFACDGACVGLGLRLAAGPVTLTATAPAGAVFGGWSGGGCAGTGPCSLALAADTTVTATFGIAGGFLTGTGPGGGPHVRLFTSGGTAVTNLMAYASGFTGGVFVAAGDLDGDGSAELITGAGAGGGPHVRVFTGDGADFGVSFLAYGAALRSGSRVASCDVDGDGRADIVTGAGPGGGPHVRVFRLAGGVPVELAGFFAFDPGFTGGVWVACGDVDGDGHGDIIVGAGEGGGPHVRVFSLASGTPVELAGFLVFDPTFLGGVRVAAADLDGDGRADIVVGAGPGGPPLVRAFSGAALAPLLNFLAYPASFAGGVFVGGAPAGHQLMTGPGAGWNPHVRVFTAALVEVASFLAYDSAFLGGVTVGIRP